MSPNHSDMGKNTDSDSESIPMDNDLRKAMNTRLIFDDVIKVAFTRSPSIVQILRLSFSKMSVPQQLVVNDLYEFCLQTMRRVNRGVNQHCKVQVLLPAMEHASLQFNSSIVRIWANLISHELITADVHPEFPYLLSRMSAEDILTLSCLGTKLCNSKKASASKLLATRLAKENGLELDSRKPVETCLSAAHLEHCALIEKEFGIYKLSQIGESFLMVLIDPETFLTIDEN
uniref:DUF4393 domain-containing protein n=1 Tax=Ningiella ruwaisensis TaxID=2364274 RepID=UPI0010A00C15|nr:DUF4393 domain-containing protein [Ningiella ruwaisensis]